MVKIIPTQKRELLTNLEVYKLVATHQEAEKAKSKGRKKANKAGKLKLEGVVGQQLIKNNKMHFESDESTVLGNIFDQFDGDKE